MGPSGATPEARQSAITLKAVSKSFGDQYALRDLTVTFPKGAVTALLGENGSGKSTLVKILCGYHAPAPGGRIEIGDTEVVTPIDPFEARRLGLRFVHQDLALVGGLSVADNLCLTHGFDAAGIVGPVRRARDRRRAQTALARFAPGTRPEAIVDTLSVAERTMVAIARAFQSTDADQSETDRIVVLDEPTATLPAGEVERVFQAVDAIRESGGTTIYVTHRIDEVLRLAEYLVVLRDGAITAAGPLAGRTGDEIVSLVLGRDLQPSPRATPGAPSTECVLRVSKLSARRLRNVSFDLHRGEILGVAGLSGSGRSELTRVLGGTQRFAGGALTLEDVSYVPLTPRQALGRGVALVSQDRLGEGIVAEMSLRANLTLTTLGSSGPWFLNHRRERSEAMDMIRAYDIRPADPERPLFKFSGGNQQKAILAKMIRTAPRVLLLDEPTQGVDAGAKHEIAAIIRELATAGTAIILATSEDSEMADLADRVLVLDRGVVSLLLEGDGVTEEAIARATAFRQS